MEQFKKDLFLKSNDQPIQIQCISESEKIILTEFVKLNIQNDFPAKQFFIRYKEILNRYIVCESLNSPKDIEQAMKRLGLFENEVVYVIWTYPNDVDKFDLNLLIKHWNDIWFGQSEDVIALFFPRSVRMILITHWNAIYY